MNPSFRKVFLFGLQFLPFFAVFLWLYPKVVPGYQWVVVKFANTVLDSLNPSMSIHINEQGGWDFTLAGPAGRGFDAGIGNLTLAYLNLALLPALLLATPVKWRQRLRMLGWGGLLLFVLHGLAAVVIVRVTLCLHYDRENVFCKSLLVLFATGGQVFGVALWALLTWRYWLPLPVPSGAPGTPGTLPSDASSATVSRNVLCPCGSGLRYKRCCGKAT